MPTEKSNDQAIACDNCRKSKRKCSSGKPCHHCARQELPCEFSTDMRKRRHKRGPITKQPTQLAKRTRLEGSEEILDFYTSSEPTGKGERCESASIWKEIYGGSYEVHADSKQPQAGSNMLKIRGMATRPVVISREEVDEALENLHQNHRIAYDSFASEELQELMESVWSPAPPHSASEWLYIYSMIGIGSLKHPVTSISQLPERVQALYLSATSQVGSAIIESSLVSGTAIACFAHFCMLVGEFLSQGKFLKAALGIFLTLGFHTDRAYNGMAPRRREFTLRMFWHVWTVSFLSSAFFTDVREIIPLEAITAPRPSKIADRYNNPSVDSDRDCLYALFKIDIITAFTDPQIDIAQLHRIYEKELEEVGKALFGDEMSELYAVVVHSLIMHLLVCKHKLQSDRCMDALKSFEKLAVEYFDMMHCYVQRRFHLGAAWYICHHVFMTSMMLIHCDRMNVRLLDNWMRIGKAVEILKLYESMIPIASSWVDILTSLKAKHECLVPPAVSTAPTTPAAPTAPYNNKYPLHDEHQPMGINFDLDFDFDQVFWQDSFSDNAFNLDLFTNL